MYSDLENSLREIEACEPIEPKIPQLIFSDATPESIAFDLYSKWPSAGIMSDEGGVVFDSRTTRNPGMLNKLWDGDSLHVSRKTSQSYIVRDARLTVSIMVQPKTLAKFLSKQGALFRDNGLGARFMFACPYSTQGTRFIQSVNPSWLNLSAFQDRLTQILDSTLPDASQNPSVRTTLKFSPEAQSSWTYFYNQVEGDLIAGRYLADVKDGASKIADNLARVAALFHYFEGNQGDISLDTMDRAAAVCSWYMHEFKRLFASAPEVPIEILDAQELERWFNDQCHRYPGRSGMKKNDITQLGPNQLRQSKIRREAALYVLTQQDRIRFEYRGKTQWVVLNPAFFPIYSGGQAHPPMPYRRCI